MARKHVHKYKKVDIGRKNGPKDHKHFVVFKCILADCTHYIEWRLAEGKFCICNRCGNLMVLTKAAMNLTLPHCPECTKRKKELPDLTDVLEKLE